MNRLAQSHQMSRPPLSAQAEHAPFRGLGMLCRLMPLFVCALAHAQAAPAPKDLVATMLDNERAAASHKVLMTYTSVEKSDRTQAHTWTERVVETPTCRIRLLQAVDGKPLSPELAEAERNRLADAVAHPDDYAAHDRQATGSDDAHAQAMLDLIGKGFFLDHLTTVNGDWRIEFRPDPDYSPSGTEEKVLHGMTGFVLIDQKSMRLHHIEGQLLQDVSLYGFLASIHSGSHFETTKLHVDNTWRTSRVVSDIRGKAALFKSVGRNLDTTRSDFHPIAQNLTVAQAVAIAEK